MSAALVVATGGLGLLVGSFLTVVVARVPAGRSVARPGSACPACAAPVRPRDNVPVVSWLLLGGRCRDCATAVPVRYPLIEAGTGLLFAALAAAYGPVAVLPALLYLAATGVALSVIDLEHHRLPDVLVLPAYPVLAVLLLAPDPAAAIAAAPRTLLSAGAWLAGYGGLWWLTAGRGMGRGDVKLSGLLGLVLGRLGWGPSVLGLFGGFAVGAAVAVVLLATGRADRRTRLAHGPFMLVGAAVAVFAGDQLWTAWLDFAAQG